MKLKDTEMRVYTLYIGVVLSSQVQFVINNQLTTSSENVLVTGWLTHALCH